MNDATNTDKSQTLLATDERVTVYVSGGLGNVVAVKSTGAHITLKRPEYSLGRSTLRVVVKKYRKRSKSAFGRDKGALCIVVKGWHGPTPEGMFGEPNAQGVATQTHDSFSDSWEANFRAQLATSGATVLFDARE